MEMFQLAMNMLECIALFCEGVYKLYDEDSVVSKGEDD